MARFKVLIADDRYAAYEEEKSVLAPLDVELLFERSRDEKVLADRVRDVDAVIVNLAPITALVISSMTKCRCVSRYGIGYDNVDVAALTRKGVCLTNVPDYCGEDVSDHALALFLDCVRKISRKDRLVRRGYWNLTGIQPVYRICGRTFGFVGFGMIARFLHRKLQGLNLGRYLAYDPYINPEIPRKAGVELVDLATLCRESDYISIHVPVTGETRSMIGREQFALMKKTAILINTSRGAVIDEGALIEALKKGGIACAGLDVFATEPLDPSSELLRLENVTLTDHAGWYSEEAMVQLKTSAARNVALVLSGQRPAFCVNPEVFR
ncbi:MAG: C-terminal binding protein [Kiritimatiellae bacterium]|nr:C-terminal binding protein [Kiritimatiellia bacterium]